MMRRLAVCFGIAALTLSTAPAGAAHFEGLGDLPDGPFQSTAYGVSADGSVVVGGGVTALGFEAFRYPLPPNPPYQLEAEHGLGYLGEGPGGFFDSLVYDVSADGSVGVGRSSSNSPVGFEPIVWTATNGMQGLGVGGQALGVSADGSVVVGIAFTASDSTAFRYPLPANPPYQLQPQHDLGDLPGGDFYSFAEDVSADGSVVVGGGSSASGGEAFRWTAADGMQPLGDLPGGNFRSEANAVSADGSVVVGFSSSASGERESFRWTAAEGMQPLGDLPGGLFESQAVDVTADGSIVLGYGTTALGEEAFIWDVAHGMRNLRDVLVTDCGLGAELDGWILSHGERGELDLAISDDGRTIVGQGISPNGYEAWIVTGIPEPATAVMLLSASLIGLLFYGRRRKRKA